MSNIDKAHAIVDEILRLDYAGDLNAMQNEMGYKEGVVQDIYFWLEEGNGDGLTVDECRLSMDLY